MSFNRTSVESRRRCSLGCDKILPRGNRNKLGYCVGTITSRQLTSCFNTSENPILDDAPNASRSAPRRRSASINKVRAPESAMVMPRLEEMVDLPSLGTALVTRKVLGRTPSHGIKKMEERTL